jgi:membrane protein implicated in regulation of membrane protease activity
MPWWGWVLVGAILLASELFVTTEFYLVFLGAAAVVVGLAAYFLELGVWQQWAVFAVLAVVFLVGFRRRLKELMAKSGDQVRDSIVGEHATVSSRIDPGRTGTVELRGSRWTARNTGDAPLEPGDRVLAVAIEGLMLDVRRE